MNSSTVRPASSKTRWSRLWLTTLQNQGLLPAAQGSAAPATTSTLRIKRLEVLPGEVQAEVHDRTQGICHIQIKVAPLAEEEWKRICDLIGRQMATTANASMSMSATGPAAVGPMSSEIETLLGECVSRLLPKSKQEIRVECRCQGAKGEPCPGLSPVYRQLGAMFDEDPWLFFRLRGRDWQQLLQTLQVRALAQSPTASTQALKSNDTPTTEAKPDHAATDKPTPVTTTSNTLLDEIHGFWGSSKQMDKFHHHFQRPAAGLMLLRRLGPLSLGEDEESFYTQLAALYGAVTEEALALAFAGEDEKGTK